MKETGLLTTNPAIEPPDTIYVHLCSGEVLEIEHVEEIVTTDQHVILTRGDREAVILDRRDVYYTCCQVGDAPSAY
jgi:hypothetical protein